MKRRVRLLLSLLPVLVSLALALGFAALWARSYRTADDWFVIYRAAGGSEQLRSWRGYLVFRHKAPDGEVPRGGVERVSHYAVRTNALPPDFNLSPGGRMSYPTHRQWGPVVYDTGRGVPLQTARAAYQARLSRPFAPSATSARLQQELKQLEAAAPPQPGPDASADAQLRWSVYQRARSLLQFQITADTRLAGQTPAFIVPEGSRWQITLPTWLPVVASTLLSVPWLLRRLRARRRRRAGLCARCGYDLRASTGRCPECGEPMPGAAPAASTAAGNGATTEAVSSA